MSSETRNCQNCKTQFVIEPDDFAFYEKMQVPPPTFCPECRLQRRLSFFNLTTLYRRPCDLCKKESVSMYSPKAPYRVFCPECWWSDSWDPFAYGREYDFSIPFFEQFAELSKEAPMLGLAVNTPTLVSSPYNNQAGYLNNCYLIFQADFNEDSAYGFLLKKNKSLLDCSVAMLSESCYDCMNSFKNNRCIGCFGNVTESIESAFLRDSSNCQNCFASANLRNKKYHIFNKPHNREDYFAEMKKWDLGSYRTYQDVKIAAREHWKKFSPRPVYDDFSTNSMGNYVFQSKNCKQCFDVEGAEDSKYLFMLSMPPLKDLYDVSSWGNGVSRSHECAMIGENASDLRFCGEAGINAYNLEYCRVVFGGSNQFGCVGTKKGEYCILNKKYSPDEFQVLRKKIIVHMDDMPYADKRGRIYKYGEFFPIELAPFAYNETLAKNFFPLSRERIEAEGFLWREAEKQTYPITKKAEELPDHVRDAKDGILDEVIECKNCNRGFRIIRMELDFLRNMNLPLPRECPFCRINEKLNQWVKNLTLVSRACDTCGEKFQTPHEKDESPEILCKNCWLKTTV